MKNLWFGVAALLLYSGAVTAQVRYDHPRVDPYRTVGLAPDGSSMANFARESRFGYALKDFFGFSDREVSEAIDKASKGEATLWQIAPGSRFDDMWGGKRHGTGAGCITFWAEYYRLEVNGKMARFLTICGNPIKLPRDGQQIKPHTEVREVPGPVREVKVPGENRYVFRFEVREKTITRTVIRDREVLLAAPAPAPLYGGEPRVIGQTVSRSTPIAAVGYRQHHHKPAGCGPGSASPPPVNGGGPPNPQDPNQGLGPPVR